MKFKNDGFHFISLQDQQIVYHHRVRLIYFLCLILEIFTMFAVFIGLSNTSKFRTFLLLSLANIVLRASLYALTKVVFYNTFSYVTQKLCYTVLSVAILIITFNNSLCINYLFDESSNIFIIIASIFIAFSNCLLGIYAHLKYISFVKYMMSNTTVHHLLNSRM